MLSGVGRAQTWGGPVYETWGGPVYELRPGDTVWIPPDEKHWHGAAPHNGMVHLAIHEHLNSVHVDWLEPVTDEQYASAPP